MSQEALNRITAEVTEMSGVIDSAVLLINSMADQIRQLATDPVALNSLADALDNKANQLAAAVAANAPAEPPAPPPVEPLLEPQ